MARIRSLKMEFFKNEGLAELSAYHRLLFQGLWFLADRDGRLEDRPARIKAEIFPYEPRLNVDRMLTELAAHVEGFIVRYEVEGRRCIQISKFLTHQRPHPHEPTQNLPSLDQAVNTPRTDMSLHDDTSTRDLDLDREGNGSRSGTDREGKGEETPTALPPIPHPQALVDLWNTLTAQPIPKCLELGDKRRRAAVARLHERPLEAWRAVIQRIQASQFCRGDNDRGWTATFDFLLKPESAAKVLEGKYDDRTRVTHIDGRGNASRDSVQRAIQKRIGNT